MFKSFKLKPLEKKSEVVLKSETIFHSHRIQYHSKEDILKDARGGSRKRTLPCKVLTVQCTEEGKVVKETKFQTLWQLA